MKHAGYVELPEFAGHEDDKHYDCYSCEYFKAKEDSPTGYWCTKFNFPDKPHGCCDGWEMAPDIRDEDEGDEFANIKLKEFISRSSKYWERRRPNPYPDAG